MRSAVRVEYYDMPAVRAIVHDRDAQRLFVRVDRDQAWPQRPFRMRTAPEPRENAKPWPRHKATRPRTSAQAATQLEDETCSSPRSTVAAHVLRAGGATIGLPLLAAMVPAAHGAVADGRRAEATNGILLSSARRDHGEHALRRGDESLDAGQEGRDFDLKPILEPFAAQKKYLTVVSGLGNRAAESPAVHAIHPGHLAHRRASLRARRRRTSAVSVDQIAARHIGQDTPLPSLELATEGAGGSSGCDATFGCSYARTISFRTPTTPMPMEADPGKVFERIFGRGKSPEERTEIANDFTSVLDLVTAEVKDLQSGLGADDRAIVNDYLDSVREIERRIQLLKARDLSSLDLPEIPVAVSGFDERLRLQFDLLALAYQTNTTRIATFMMCAEVSNQSYAHVGVPDAFHPLSHHAESKASMEKLAIVQNYHSKVFSEFLAKLAATPDGDRGSMLDNSIFLYGSNMSNSNNHDSFPFPTLVFGTAGAKSRATSTCATPITRRSAACSTRCCCAPAYRSTRSATARASSRRCEHDVARIAHRHRRAAGSRRARDRPRRFARIRRHAARRGASRRSRRGGRPSSSTGRTPRRKLRMGPRPCTGPSITTTRTSSHD